MAIDPAVWAATSYRRPVTKRATSPQSEWQALWCKGGSGSGTGSPSAGTLDRIQTSINQSGNTTWRGAIFEGMDGGWGHVVHILNASAAPAIWVNGVDETDRTSGPNGTRMGNLAGPLVIGGSDDAGGQLWLGKLTCIAFYNAALTGTQIRSHHAAMTDLTSYVNAVNADSPSAFWKMQETSGALIDAVGAKNASLITGSPTYAADGPVSGVTAIDFPGSAYFEAADDNLWSSTTCSVEYWAWVPVGWLPHVRIY